MGNFTRREFIKTVTACAAAGASMRILMPGVDQLAHAAISCGTDKRTLVHLYLHGGADGASILIPKNIASYLDVRPSLGIPNPTNLNFTGNFGLHANLAAGADGHLLSHANAGRVAFICNSGVPNHSQSHEYAQAVYATGIRQGNGPYGKPGWASRIGDNYCLPGDNLAIFSFRGRVREIVGPSFVAASAGQLSKYSFVNESSANLGESRYRRDVSSAVLNLSPNADPQAVIYRNARGSIDSTVNVVQAARTAYEAWSGKATYQGDSTSQRLKDTASMIYGGLNPTVALITLGGFDTHKNQNGATGLPGLLTDINNAVRSFMQDIEAMAGLGIIATSDVKILIESEFSRTVKENATAGTDHGKATAGILIGHGVNGGHYGGSYTAAQFTSASNTFPVEVDFREYRAQVFAKHLGLDPAVIQPEGFNTVGLPNLINS